MAGCTDTASEYHMITRITVDMVYFAIHYCVFAMQDDFPWRRNEYASEHSESE